MRKLLCYVPNTYIVVNVALIHTLTLTHSYFIIRLSIERIKTLFYTELNTQNNKLLLQNKAGNGHISFE